MHKTLARTSMVLVGAMAAVAVAAPAFAHVTVNPNSATQGGYTKLTFRVPNEKATADTVSLEVDLPTDTPIASVSLKPVPGWTAVATKTKLPTPIKDDDGGEITEAVTQIVWTASSDAVIKPGQFQEFDVSAGPLPSVDQIVFKALQKYSDGDTVRWIDESKPGVEAEHPAPVLKLAKAATTANQPAGVSVSGSPAAPAPAASTGDDSSSNSTGVVLGIIALVVAIGAVVLALLPRRRGAAPPTA